MDGLIYAYHTPKSAAQLKYTQERIAAIAEQRRQRALQSDLNNQLERTTSNTSSLSVGQSKDSPHHEDNHGDMEQQRLHTASSSGSSSQSEIAHQGLLNNPFELRFGRRSLRELPYPLPVDLPEVQRQNLRTLLCCKVFGRAVCSPRIHEKIPKRVLELGCGSGYWSAMCHDYLTLLGHKNVSFTGLDVAPLAPDLRKQGVNWTFVRHDLRRLPYPFESDSFDLVMLKDMSLVLPLGVASQKLIDESIRILDENGTLEIWESDYVIRSLVPHPPNPSKQLADQEVARKTATFIISPGTPFTPAQNKYLQQANTWIQNALDRRKLPPTPCARIQQILVQEPDSLDRFGSRRVAIPLGEMRWERDGSGHCRNPSDKHDSVMMPRSKGKGIDRGLTPDQAALRQTALLTVLHMIESLEPLLKEASGKNSEEWSRWWASMMAELSDPANKTAVTGECLEIGAWWASKIETP
jgi:SAM-dependent methyltransferase